ncbi:MAG TPA: DUF1844 domain-containing protein [Tepidisphaeraceae bacterium]|jgi:hypothetical protein|nr:DUF1844 domain-containing protein [Tepidisphaeraceae bacterium]
MAEEKLGLHVDTDWKKQAQEEKRKLAEQEEKRKTAALGGAPAGVMGGSASAGAAAAGGASGGGAGGAGRQAGGRGAAGQRELPPASFATLVQSLLTQVLFYLGDLSTRGAEPMINLDMAKHNIDTLSVLEEKTRGNLTEEEKRLLDAALYEARMRYVALASRYAELP